MYSSKWKACNLQICNCLNFPYSLGFLNISCDVTSSRNGRRAAAADRGTFCTKNNLQLFAVFFSIWGKTFFFLQNRHLSSKLRSMHKKEFFSLGNRSILRNHQFRRISSTHHLIFTCHHCKHFDQNFHHLPKFSHLE